MNLEQIDNQLLSGELGPAAQRAMRLLLSYASVLDADRFISIESAHIDSCLYHGPSGLDFVNSFLNLEGQVRVPNVVNVGLLYVSHPEYSQALPSLTEAQRSMARAYQDLGCLPTLTCAPYQRQQRPQAGQHIAWAESNAMFSSTPVWVREQTAMGISPICVLP